MKWKMLGNVILNVTAPNSSFTTCNPVFFVYPLINGAMSVTITCALQSSRPDLCQTVFLETLGFHKKNMTNGKQMEFLSSKLV